MTSTARGAFWFEWRRAEAAAQLACSRADTLGEDDDPEYVVLCDIHDRLSWPQRVWLGVYELRRSYIRVRNRRLAGKV